MLNLSDKELDRLSREAASQHDPGDPLGPGSWDRLASRLDKEMGRVAPNPNPLRGIRRLPFQYAPVIILLVGVSYYFVRQFNKPRKAEATGSPPMSVIKSTQPDLAKNVPSLNTLDNRQNFTPAPNPQNADSTIAIDSLSAAGRPSSNGTPASHDAASPINAAPASGAAAATAGSSAPAVSASHSGPSATAGLKTGSSTPAGAVASAGISSSGTRSLTSGSTLKTRPHRHALTQGLKASAGTAPGSRQDLSGRQGKPGNKTSTENAGAANSKVSPGATIAKEGAVSSANIPSGSQNTAQHPLAYAPVQRAHSLAARIRINDSSLTAYTPPAQTPVSPGKGKGRDRSLNINRSLQIGAKISPDFSSVNSLAGDRPGSAIGLTLDWQFANRFYLGTGLLISKKIYSARIQDCQLPNDYLRANGMHDVDFVKGNLKMLEIPLNLRYDFSSVGNTRFFASAGLSSYIMTGQNSDYYYNLFGREAYRRFHYADKKIYPFAAVNLSIGIEAGLTNSLSLLLAPYAKLPTSNIGFEDLRINSVGFDIGLKFSPVISRKRK